MTTATSMGFLLKQNLDAFREKKKDIVNEADAKTDPDMVQDFVKQTGCDLLAVAVGNVHGLDIEPKVDLPLLKKISEPFTGSSCYARRFRNPIRNNSGGTKL